MKNSYKVALLAALGLTVAVAAQAQTPVANDLVLGFTSTAPGVTSDYIVDLGQLPTAQNTQIGSGVSLATLSSVFGSALANGQVNAGIVGGTAAGSKAAFTTTLDNGTGTATVAGSTAPISASKSQLSQVGSIATSLTTGVVSQNPVGQIGFFTSVAETPTTVGSANNNVASDLGSNPLSTIGTSEIITLDLWKNAGTAATGTAVTGWQYEGDIQIDLSGTTASVVFDPAASSVPEPTTYGLLAGAGLLVVSLRNKLARKNA